MKRLGFRKILIALWKSFVRSEKKKKFKSLGERSRVVAKIPWVAVRLLETSADESSEDLTIHWIPDRCMTLRKASSRHAEKKKNNGSWKHLMARGII